MKCLKAQAHTWWIVVSNNADKFYIFCETYVTKRKQNPNVRLAKDGSTTATAYQQNHIQRFPRKINYYMRTLCILLNYISVSKKQSRLKSNGRNLTGCARMSDYENTLFRTCINTRNHSYDRKHYWPQTKWVHKKHVALLILFFIPLVWFVLF